MNHLFRIACCMIVAMPQLAYSGQVNNTVIDTVTVNDDGLVRATMSGGTEVYPKAACSASIANNEYIYDLIHPLEMGGMQPP